MGRVPGRRIEAPEIPTTDAAPLVRRLLRHPLVGYVVIGGLSFVVDAGLLWLSTSVLGWPVWVGGSVGYWSGVVVNFTLNRVLMAPRSGGLVRQTVRYGLLLGLNYLVTLGVLHLAAASGVPVLLAKTVVVAASTLWNYLLYRLWVFA